MGCVLGVGDPLFIFPTRGFFHEGNNEQNETKIKKIKNNLIKVVTYSTTTKKVRQVAPGAGPVDRDLA